MHFSSYKSSNPMENEMCSNVPPDRAEMLDDDDATSLRISGSYVDHFPSAYDLSNQNQIMSEHPVFSALQGEPICDLLAGAHISNQPVYLASDAFVSRGHRIGDATLVGSTWLDGETVCEEQIAEGTLVPATMLASLLASRGCVYRNVDDSALCSPSMPFDMSYNSNQMHAGMADEIWVQPSTVFHGISVSHSAEQGYYFDSWISNRKANLATDYQYGTPMFNNELSPSPSGLYQSSIHEQCSELGPSGITNHYDSGGRASEQSSSTKTNDRSLTYASRGKSQSTAASSSSSYLRAVRQILADLSSFSLENVDYGIYSTCSPSNVASVSAEYLESDGNESSQGTSFSLQRQEEVGAKKKQLKALLKMVDEGYNQCLRDVHNVISAFHPIIGLEPEVSARIVLQTTSCLYKSLKEKISAQIFNNKANIQSDSSTERERAFESSFIHKQWALQQLRRKEHQLWRPQRGLPERSVSVLRAWMFQNFLHPYPKDSDKHMLAIKSGLTRSQVSNWFINARVRLWKPMIEEMYAEINRRKTHQKTHLGENSASLLLGKSTIPM